MGMVFLNFKDYLGVDSSARMAVAASRMGSGQKVVVAPSIASLSKVYDALRKSRRNIALCTQNLDLPGSAGPYTGKTTVDDFKMLGCTYALIGHSEVRHRDSPESGESDEMVAMKLRLALDSGLAPILCFGETGREKEAGRTKAVAIKQVKSSLSHVKRRELGRIIFAYEPVWAIRGHKNAQACSVEHAAYVVEQVRKSAGLGKSARFLYGGSVNGKNVGSYLEGGFYGVLVGRAGTDAKSLREIFAGVNRHGNS